MLCNFICITIHIILNTSEINLLNPVLFSSRQEKDLGFGIAAKVPQEGALVKQDAKM